MSGQTTGTAAARGLRRSSAVTLGVTALLAAGLSGCGSSEEQVESQAVCVDEVGNRVDDDRCDDDDGYGYRGGFGWYFIPIGRPFPALGARATGGTLTPAGGRVTARGGLPSSGGSSVAPSTVTRGGFGGSGGDGSGG